MWGRQGWDGLLTVPPGMEEGLMQEAEKPAAPSVTVGIFQVDDDVFDQTSSEEEEESDEEDEEETEEDQPAGVESVEELAAAAEGAAAEDLWLDSVVGQSNWLEQLEKANRSAGKGGQVWVSALSGGGCLLSD